MECGKVLMGIHTLENGKTQKHMAKVFIFARTEIDMKDSGQIVLNMVQEQIYSILGILL